MGWVLASTVSAPAVVVYRKLVPLEFSLTTAKNEGKVPGLIIGECH